MSVSDARKLSAEGISIAELSRLPFCSCFLGLLPVTPLSTSGFSSITVLPVSYTYLYQIYHNYMHNILFCILRESLVAQSGFELAM